jgi:hypothetical protein
MRRALGLILAAAWMALGPARAQALEKQAPAQVDIKETAEADQVSLKPVFLFSMRGRVDPFVAYPVMTATAKVDALNISQLTFKGLLGMRGQELALFQFNRLTFVLKAGKLIGVDGQPVEGIAGGVDNDHNNGIRVTLVQGERKLTFSAKRSSKRLDDQANQE